MKNLLATIFLLGLVSSANAAFTNIGGNVIRDDVSGLDWLSLTVTAGQAYNQAAALNPQWRYATNMEVTDMFTTLFPRFVPRYGGYDDFVPADVAAFQDLFGIAYADYSYQGGAFFSYGFYKDENSILRMTGALNMGGVRRAFGLDYYINYDSKLDLGAKWFGVYMVRNTNVPESYSLYLFMFGLLGLLTAVRTK